MPDNVQQNKKKKKNTLPDAVQQKYFMPDNVQQKNTLPDAVQQKIFYAGQYPSK